MHNSIITKNAIAEKFKELVLANSFEKVRVSHICDACNISRKTFYYHFEDKYELAYWIFDSEFVKKITADDMKNSWLLMEKLCSYLYGEREFYKKLMEFAGQNSFRQYFQDFLLEAIEAMVVPDETIIKKMAAEQGITTEALRNFYIYFLNYALIGTVLRWMYKGADISPEKLVSLLKSTSEIIMLAVYENNRK